MNPNIVAVIIAAVLAVIAPTALWLFTEPKTRCRVLLGKRGPVAAAALAHVKRTFRCNPWL